MGVRVPPLAPGPGTSRKPMKQLLRTILIALLLTAVGIQTSAAQYYYNYYPHNYGSGTVHPGYAPARG